MHPTAPTLRRLGSVVSVGAVLLGTATATVPAVAQPPEPTDGPVVSMAMRHDTSPPLRALAEGTTATSVTIPLAPDQTSPSEVETSGLIPPTDVNFEAMGAGLPEPNDAYGTVPDPNAAVGLTQVVQAVNDALAVFGKDGTIQLGPIPHEALFEGFGGQCEETDHGDAVIRHDNLANRWVFSKMVVTEPYGLCYAVSATEDATGSWHRYFFPQATEPDYQKFGVWPDGYYATYRGPVLGVCALERAQMLAGQPASQQCFESADNVGSFQLPSDIEGTTPPPAGAPNLIVGSGIHRSNQELTFQKFHVDWSNPANSSLSPIQTVPVTPFDDLAVRSPQPGTDQRLITYHGTGTFHFGYRNFGTHQSLLFDFDLSVDEDNRTGIRWYELRLDENGDPVVHQEGTYAPDDDIHRWMGDLAMDRFGNMALGYSVSNATDVYPGIRYTGRLAGDPLGQMTLGEGVIMAGTGSQTEGYPWGDYSSMSVDPVDDCTFWYTHEYIAAGANDWHTRIAAFHFPGCEGSVPQTVFADDFETDRGWVANPAGTDTASAGQFERGDPEATTYQGTIQPGTATSGSNDLVTGRLAGAGVGANDIDGGTTSIRSPQVALPATGDLSLTFDWYLAHANNASNADALRVWVQPSGGTALAVFEREGAPEHVTGTWQTATVDLSPFAGRTIHLLVEAADAGNGSLVEAGVDNVSITRT